MAKRIGESVIALDDRVCILGHAAVGCRKESEGPLAADFDALFLDSSLGEPSWEKAESALQKAALDRALVHAGLEVGDLHCLFAGDLLNQCVASHYHLRNLGTPVLGLYGACSTMTESLLVASVFVDSGSADRCGAVTSSHFCSAERQFRYPLEYGGQRAPTAQWTATASGAAIVGVGDKRVRIADVCPGRIIDKGVTDINNMGACMAPAAADTLLRYFRDTNTQPTDYDLVVTGDLGLVGSDLLSELLKADGVDLADRHRDCGLMIYDREKQDVHAGGSGCGCSASVLCGHLLKQMDAGRIRNMLILSTGALMSPTANQQGESIPGVAHLVHLVSE
ncbi:MAG: stage V sporulation protein AD [Clostridia bacterium]|nr:stage V sporulation protein AD [Clostridia bacterium]